MKLQQQREMQKREEELQLMEKKKRAMMLLEEQPTFAQLYLNCERIGRGGITIDRDGNELTEARILNEREKADSLVRDMEDSESHHSNQQKLEEVSINLNLPSRNLYVVYKAFPSLEKLMSSVQWNQSEPQFSYRS
jgi:hypothetical protein